MRRGKRHKRESFIIMRKYIGQTVLSLPGWRLLSRPGKD